MVWVARPMAILRCERDVPVHRAKIGNACDVDIAAAISCPDAPASTIFPKPFIPRSRRLYSGILLA